MLSEPIATAYTWTPAWSPDGRLIAYTESSTKEALGRLTVFDMTSQHKRVVIVTDDLVLSNPHWSPDARTLLVVYTRRSAGLTRFAGGRIAGFRWSPDARSSPCSASASAATRTSCCCATARRTARVR